MIEINDLEGVTGYAFDKHIDSSEFLGYDENDNPRFDTKYTDMGSAVNQLKYRDNTDRVETIMELLKSSAKFQDFINAIDVILPIPPHTQRKDQPVYAVAESIVACYQKTINYETLCSSNKKSIKGLSQCDKEEVLNEHCSVNSSLIDKTDKILLFDDLYDTGTTLNVYAKKLIENGYCNISFFTLTKTKGGN